MAVPIKTWTSLHPTQKKVLTKMPLFSCNIMFSGKDVVKCLVDHLLQERYLSTPERIQTWPANVCKRPSLAHATFTSIRGTFIQQTDLFHAALRPANPSGYKNAPSKIPTWIYFKSQGLKEKYWIFLSSCCMLVTTCVAFADVHSLPPPPQASRTPARCHQASPSPRASREPSNKGWLCPTEAKLKQAQVSRRTMPAPNLSNGHSKKSVHIEFCGWTPNQAGHTSSHSKNLYPSWCLSYQTNHPDGESVLVHILLAWHSSGMGPGRDQRSRLSLVRGRG